MSLRALRVFDRKMREHEAALASRLAATVPVIRVPARPQITDGLREQFADLRDEWESTGDWFLSNARDETFRLLDRDLRDFEAAGVDTSEVDLQYVHSGRAAMQSWREYMEGLVERALDEVERQGNIAWDHDDPKRSGWSARVNSPEPLQVIGRPGMGVVPILPSIVKGRLADMAFSMANRVRLDHVEQLDE